MDVGSHIVAEENLEAIDQSRDVPRRLREHGDISEDLEQRWTRMIGFRNILVHEYAEVDHAEVDRSLVYQIVCERLPDLEEMRKVFARFL